MEPLTAGDEVLVRYRGYAHQWHARILLAQIFGSEWLTYTPDGDSYPEDLSAWSEEVADVEPRVGAGGARAPAPPGEVYDFGERPMPHVLRTLLQDGALYATRERRARGLPDPGRVAALVAGVEAAAPPPAPERVAAAPFVYERPHPPEPHVLRLGGGRGPYRGLRFEGEAGAAAGPAVGPVPLAAAHGPDPPFRRGGGPLHAAAGRPGMGRGLDDLHVLEPADEVAPDDARTLPVRFDTAGKRTREFRDFCSLMSQDEWEDWPVRGPRTCRWVLSFMLEHGGTPRGWHRQWQAAMRLQATDAGVALHEVCCLFLESLCTYDQLNAPNLAAGEHAARQLQAVEERWKDRAIGSNESLEAQADIALYAGQQTRGNLCICPALAEWISTELRSEAAISKERRKAREERALARPKQHAKKGATE